MTLKWFLVMFFTVFILHGILALAGVALVLFTFWWFLKVILVGIAGAFVANVVAGK